jgi:hypothetical protein
MLCGHCGKQSIFQIRGEGTRHGVTLLDPIRSYDEGIDGQTITTWKIMECALCAKPTLIEETVDYWFDRGDYRAAEVQSAQTEVLYPIVKVRSPLTNLPVEVEMAYAEALKVHEVSPNACAVMIGRTLEALCSCEGVRNGVLATRLRELAGSGRIPTTLADMASTASRKYHGSLGARRPFVRPVKRTIGKTIVIGNEGQDSLTQVSDRRPTGAS